MTIANNVGLLGTNEDIPTALVPIAEIIGLPSACLSNQQAGLQTRGSPIGFAAPFCE